MKRKLATHKQRLEHQAMGLWKIACMKKWGNICECCGKPASTYHHFIERSRCTNLKYDVENGVPLCGRYGNNCHYNIHFSHDTLVRYNLKKTIIDKRGPEWLAYITKQSKVKGLKTNVSWLEECIAKLEAVI